MFPTAEYKLELSLELLVISWVPHPLVFVVYLNLVCLTHPAGLLSACRNLL